MLARLLAGPVSLERQLQLMRRDWDQRARQNAHHFVATGKPEWTDEAFFASGEQTVADTILGDLTDICQGKAPAAMRVLEIGCGAGRVTRALARLFGEVHAVDISEEMLHHARRALAGIPNAHLYRNNGMDLGVVPALPFDFAFSIIVFQHIPSRQVIASYVREVHRLLRPGALFKFQVRGNTADPSTPDNTWVGAALSEDDATAMALECGFEPRYSTGAGTPDFWLWFFKKGTDAFSL